MRVVGGEPNHSQGIGAGSAEVMPTLTTFFSFANSKDGLISEMHSKKLARNVILVASILITLAAVTLIAAIHIHGNHSLGEDDSGFQTAMSVGITIVTCMSTLLLGVVICNCRDLLGSNYAKVAFGAGVLLFICELATFFWLRAGLEHSMASRDTTGKANAEEVAWLDVEKRLQAQVQATKADGTEVIGLRTEINATREKLASLSKQANDLDNDGIKNDHLIPGLLAEAESRKADLANLESRLEQALSRDAATVEHAVAALSAHQATRAAVLGGIAQAQADQHQFVRWAQDIEALAPSLPAGLALQIVLGLVAFSLMVPQYAGLAGISAALKIQVEAPAAVTLTTSESDKDQGTPEAAPGNVIQGEFAIDEIERLNLNESRKLARACRDMGLVQISGREISTMRLAQARELIRKARGAEMFAQLTRSVA